MHPVATYNQSASDAAFISTGATQAAFTSPKFISPNDIVEHTALKYIKVADNAYVMESDPHVTLFSQHDWGKLGITTVDASSDRNGFLEREDLTNITSEGTENFQTIYHLIVNDNDELIPGKIRDDNIAAKIHNLIIKYQSEWSRDTWSALESKLQNKPNLLQFCQQFFRAMAWITPEIINNGLSQHLWHMHPCNSIKLFKSPNISIKEAQIIAISVLTGFEGRTPMDYTALAGDFDQQGMSFGLLQWNVGQSTLIPVLADMISLDEDLFDSCFSDNMKLSDLKEFISINDVDGLRAWAIDAQTNHHTEWVNSFTKLGQQDKFNKIQFKHAIKYHNNVVSCIKLMRRISKKLMYEVELRTYVALFDLCVQQGSLTLARNQIIEKFTTQNIMSQKEFLILAVTERAKKIS